MRRRLLIIANILVGLTACAIPFTQDRAVDAAVSRYETAYSAVTGNSREAERNSETISEILGRVHRRYVDIVDVEQMVDLAITEMKNTPKGERQEPELSTRTIKAMLSSLDKYTGYMSPAEYGAYQQSLKGNFVGFGVRIRMKDGYLTVIKPLKGSPAKKAGILKDDRITHIDGASLKGFKLAEAVSKIRGPEGSTATLTIARAGESLPIDFTLKRKRVEIAAVEHRIDGDIGYIRIHTFNKKTADGVETALNVIDRKLGSNLCGVILDMRNNPGGLVSAAVSVASDFMDGGNILDVRYRGESAWEREAQSGDRINGRPMLVLLNHGSASSAEIVAGALQNSHRAMLFGEQSFGKGVMQTLIDLDNGGGLRVTTGRFTAGGGASFNGSGLTPDILDVQVKGEDDLAQVGRAAQALKCNPSVTTAAAATD